MQKNLEKSSNSFYKRCQVNWKCLFLSSFRFLWGEAQTLSCTWSTKATTIYRKSAGMPLMQCLVYPFN